MSGCFLYSSPLYSCTFSLVFCSYSSIFSFIHLHILLPSSSLYSVPIPLFVVFLLFISIFLSLFLFFILFILLKGNDKHIPILIHIFHLQSSYFLPVIVLLLIYPFPLPLLSLFLFLLFTMVIKSNYFTSDLYS